MIITASDSSTAGGGFLYYNDDSDFELKISNSTENISYYMTCEADTD